MMIDCLIAFKNISLITWRQQAERDIFYEAQRVLSIATQDGVVSKFLLKKITLLRLLQATKNETR